jgi:hypothetical protein
VNGNTGIVKTSSGAWRAVVNGRLIGSPRTGPGAKRAAILAAGTNRRVDLQPRDIERQASL